MGLAFLATYLLDARLGYAFSHGFIDYALYYVNNIRPWIEPFPLNTDQVSPPDS